MPGPASLHSGVHRPLSLWARAGDSLAPLSFWGEGEAGEAQIVSGGESRPPQLFEGPVGGSAPGHPVQRVPTLSLFPITIRLSWPPPLALPIDTWAPVSLPPPPQGLRDSVTQTVLAKLKLSHLGTPPGESIKAAVSPGERQEGTLGSRNQDGGACVSRGSAARQGWGRAAGTRGQGGRVLPL